MYLVKTTLCLFICFTILSLLIVQPNYAAKEMHLDKQIERALYAEGFTSITVDVIDKGIVRLKGKVDFLNDKYHIHKIATAFSQVNHATSEIVVDTPEKSDSDIKKDVINILDQLYPIQNNENINVLVTNGIVNLSGQVEHHRIKVMARRATSWIAGVKGIINDIKIEPPATKMENLKEANIGSIQNIIQELLWTRYPQEDNIKYLVEKGSVDLWGSVSNIYIKRALENDISNILGVTIVKSELSIKHPVQ